MNAIARSRGQQRGHRGPTQIHGDPLLRQSVSPLVKIATSARLGDRSWDFMNYIGYTRGLTDADGYGVRK